jgi:uncharacterized GH25 family protein
VTNVEINLMKSDDTKAKLTTDAKGLTPPIGEAGRYGAWARFTEAKAGEIDGKKYTETRHYATLVFDVAK